MNSPSYPSPDQLEIPSSGNLSPDQEYYRGWMVQHARLWLLVVFLGITNLISIGVNVLQVTRYKPAVAYMTLEGGYPVVWNDKGILTINGSEYEPALLRAMTRSFIENRYGYHWRFPGRINDAVRLMTPEAVELEKPKIAAANLTTNVLANKAEYDLQLDYEKWVVAAQGNGVFEVTVPGVAYIRDAVRFVDQPYPKQFEIKLMVKKVDRSETNPYGYVVIETGSDII